MSRGLLSILTLLLGLVAACGGEGGKYAGTWKRDLYGEGEVHMKLASNGGVELMLPSPRWPDSVDMKGRGRFNGDTLVFKADTAASACQTGEARYVVSRDAGPAPHCRPGHGHLRWSPGSAGRDLAEVVRKRGRRKRGRGGVGKEKNAGAFTSPPPRFPAAPPPTATAGSHNERRRVPRPDRCNQCR